MGVDVATEDLPARIDRAIGTDRFRVVLRFALGGHQIDEVRIVPRHQTHPRRRYVDAMGGIGRVVGKPATQAAAGLNIMMRVASAGTRPARWIATAAPVKPPMMATVVTTRMPSALGAWCWRWFRRTGSC